MIGKLLVAQFVSRSSSRTFCFVDSFGGEGGDLLLPQMALEIVFSMIQMTFCACTATSLSKMIINSSYQKLGILLAGENIYASKSPHELMRMQMV